MSNNQDTEVIVPGSSDPSGPTPPPSDPSAVHFSRLPLHPRFGSILPPELVEAFMRGDYAIGSRQNHDHAYLGFILKLRGVYMYEVFDTEKKVRTHGGLAWIDFHENDLTFAGVRLYTNGEKLNCSEPKMPLYWRSAFSKWVDVAGKKSLYYGYYLHFIDDHYHDSYKLGTDQESQDQRRRLQKLDVHWETFIDGYLGKAYAAQIWDEIQDEKEGKDNKNNASADSVTQRLLCYLTDRRQFDRDLALLDEVNSKKKVPDEQNRKEDSFGPPIRALLRFHMDELKKSRKDSFTGQYLPIRNQLGGKLNMTRLNMTTPTPGETGGEGHGKK